MFDCETPEPSIPEAVCIALVLTLARPLYLVRYLWKWVTR